MAESTVEQRVASSTAVVGIRVKAENVQKLFVCSDLRYTRPFYSGEFRQAESYFNHYHSHYSKLPAKTISKHTNLNLEMQQNKIQFVTEDQTVVRTVYFKAAYYMTRVSGKNDQIIRIRAGQNTGENNSYFLEWDISLTEEENRHFITNLNSELRTFRKSMRKSSANGPFGKHGGRLNLTIEVEPVTYATVFEALEDGCQCAFGAFLYHIHKSKTMRVSNNVVVSFAGNVDEIAKVNEKFEEKLGSSDEQGQQIRQGTINTIKTSLGEVLTQYEKDQEGKYNFCVQYLLAGVGANGALQMFEYFVGHKDPCKKETCKCKPTIGHEVTNYMVALGSGADAVKKFVNRSLGRFKSLMKKIVTSVRQGLDIKTMEVLEFETMEEVYKYVDEIMKAANRENMDCSSLYEVFTISNGNEAFEMQMRGEQPSPVRK